MDGTAALRVDAARVLEYMLDDDMASPALRADLLRTIEMCSASTHPENKTLLLTQDGKMYRKKDAKSKTYETEPIYRKDKDGKEIPVHYRLRGEKASWQLESLQSYLEPDSAERAEWGDVTRMRAMIFEVEAGKYGPLLNVYNVSPDLLGKRMEARAAQAKTPEDIDRVFAAEKEWLHDPASFELLGFEEFAYRHNPGYNLEKGKDKLTYVMLPNLPGVAQKAADVLGGHNVPTAILERNHQLMVMFPSFAAKNALHVLQTAPETAPHARNLDEMLHDKQTTDELREDFPEIFVDFDRTFKKMTEENARIPLRPALGKDDIPWLPPDVRKEFEAGAHIVLDTEGYPLVDPDPPQLRLSELPERQKETTAPAKVPAKEAKAKSKAKPRAKKPAKPKTRPPVKLVAESPKTAPEPETKAPEPEQPSQQEPVMDAKGAAEPVQPEPEAPSEPAAETHETAEDLTFDDADTAAPAQEEQHEAEQPIHEDLAFDDADTAAPAQEEQAKAEQPAHEPPAAQEQAPAPKANEAKPQDTPAVDNKIALMLAHKKSMAKKEEANAKRAEEDAKADIKAEKKQKEKSKRKFTGANVPKVALPDLPPTDMPYSAASSAAQVQLESLRRLHASTTKSVEQTGSGHVRLEPAAYKQQQQTLRDSLDGLVAGVFDAIHDPRDFIAFLNIGAKVPCLSPKNWAALYGQHKEGTMFMTKQDWWKHGYGVGKRAEPTYLWNPKFLTNPDTGEEYKVYNAIKYYEASQTFASSKANDGEQKPLEDIPTPVDTQTLLEACEASQMDEPAADAAIRMITTRITHNVDKNRMQFPPAIRDLAIRAAVYITCVNLGIDTNCSLGERMKNALLNKSADAIEQAFAIPAINEQGKDSNMMENVLLVVQTNAMSITRSSRDKVKNYDKFIGPAAKKPQQKAKAKPKKTRQPAQIGAFR